MANGLRYHFAYQGLMVEGDPILRNYRFLVNPFSEINDYPSKPGVFEPHRVVFDFEVVDNESNPVNIDLILTVFITEDDITFAHGDFNAIRIFKWVNQSWIELHITQRWLIPPLYRSVYGESYVGYLVVSYNPKTDPPIAVGR